MKSNNTQDSLSNGWFMLANMLPPVGFFLYFKYRNQFPNKAKKALTGAIVGVPVGIIMGYLMNTYIIN